VTDPTPATPRFALPPLENDLLLRAVNHLPVPRVPAWLMRQAGRSDPEYLAYRERAGLGLRELFRHPGHAVEISLLPRRIGVDAIILFQDILTPLAPMGADFDFAPGPVLAEPVRTAERVASLRPYDPAAALGFVGESIAGVLDRLEGALPLLGFAGAPFTLAAFMIEGRSPGAALPATEAFIRDQPEAFGDLTHRLTDMTLAYLNYKLDCGVHAVQLFESLGHLASREVYERYIQPSHRRIAAGLQARAPLILFVRGSPFPDLMLASGAAVLSVAENVTVGDMLARGGGRVAVQGNVDNRLLAEGTPEQVAAAVHRCLAEGGGRGHILNLNHGILSHTPFENVCRFITAAREVGFFA